MRLGALTGGGDILMDAEDAACWRAAREFTWRPEDAALVKVPVTPGRIARLEADLTGFANLSGLVGDVIAWAGRWPGCRGPPQRWMAWTQP